ncbi:hypothetical protein SD70_21125 [Gordoniibacillus kamchatkensis]|uniref:Uncharacterized protein n=1 Tax=Gordoniibacillus kamchatkensis TaxID=1590651 RepID=A0ABR5AE25_9BACL|nr:hypothetical protein [Paenibacillus sp. VKM B-2647]KIL39299.1 hypothetical protein SD70_21125 [Paenibacillus sp. VKM B-2647]
MSNLLLASQFNRVSIPIGPFINSSIIYQIICHVQGLSTDQVIVIAPFNEDYKNSDKYMFVGYSQRLRRIEHLTLEQVFTSFDLLMEKLADSSDDTQPLTAIEIQEAKERLQQINSKIAVGSDVHFELTDKISVLLNNSGDEHKSELWSLKIDFSSLVFEPLVFEFVGYKGSDDKINIFMEMGNTENFKKMHLLDDVKIYIDYGDGFNLEYSGICTNMFLIDKAVVKFNIESMVYDLKKSKNEPVSRKKS